MADADLRNMVAELDRRILSDPGNKADRFARLTSIQKQAGLLHGDRPICPFLRPMFLSLSEYRAVSHAAEVITSAMERICEVALHDDELLDELDVKGRELDLARVDPGYRRAGLTTRLDTYLSDDGFGFLEYNGESPAGVGDQLQLENMLFELPEVHAFLSTRRRVALDPRKKLLEALVSGYREWGGTTAEPTIGIVDWSGVPTQSEFHVLRDAFETRGYPTVIADPSELSYDGSVFRSGDQPVDIVYKRVIIHEFLSRTDDGHALTRAYRDGRIFMANSFRCKVAHKKASFAIVSDPRFARLFTDEQLAAAAAHVPWTRRVRNAVVDYEGEAVPMRELLLEERERLVLKPNDDYGGHGVTVGFATNESEWELAVDHAFTGAWVVQRRVPVRTEAIPYFNAAGEVTTADLTIDFDPFVFDGKVEGGMVRLSGTALSNISAGGAETAVVVIDV